MEKQGERNKDANTKNGSPCLGDELRRTFDQLPANWDKLTEEDTALLKGASAFEDKPVNPKLILGGPIA